LGKAVAEAHYRLSVKIALGGSDYRKRRENQSHDDNKSEDPFHIVSPYYFNVKSIPYFFA
jgi:hypothetical protein